jgi:hypothetical protein
VSWRFQNPLTTSNRHLVVPTPNDFSEHRQDWTRQSTSLLLLTTPAVFQAWQLLEALPLSCAQLLLREALHDLGRSSQLVGRRARRERELRQAASWWHPNPFQLMLACRSGVATNSNGLAYSPKLALHINGGGHGQTTSQLNTA